MSSSTTALTTGLARAGRPRRSFGGGPRWLPTSRISTLSLALGLLLAIGAALLAYLAVQTARGSQPAPVTEVLPVVVAAQDITPGAIVDTVALKTLFRVERQPAAQVPDDALTSPVVLEGRTFAKPVRAGERITASALTPLGSAGSLLTVVPPGYLAITIPVNELVTVGGAVGPQDKVDVIVSMAVPQPSGPNNTPGRMVTQVLMRDVQVLAAGVQTAPSASGQKQVSPTLTLALTPQDAVVMEHLLSANVRFVFGVKRPGEPPTDTLPMTTEEIARRYGLVNAP